MDTEVAKNLVIAGRIDNLSFAPLAPRRRLPTRRVGRFAGREEELNVLNERIDAESTQPLAVHQLHGLSASGGVGKTELAIEFAWRCFDSKAYPGGCYFLSADKPDPEPVLAELAAAVGIDAVENVPETARRVRAAIEGVGQPSLIVVDNVADGQSWLRWRDALPGPPAKLLVTTRSENLPAVEMLALGRLLDGACLEVLANFRSDVKQEASKAAAENIMHWLDGWAVAIALVGAYMALNEAATWPELWNHLNDSGLPGLRQLSDDEVRRELAYQQHIDALLDEVLDRLEPVERRLLDYAALLPEDQAPTPWLVDLISKDDIEVKPVPGVPDPVAGGLRHLVALDLLRQRESEGEMLALHRVLRRRVRELLGVRN